MRRFAGLGAHCLAVQTPQPQTDFSTYLLLTQKGLVLLPLVVLLLRRRLAHLMLVYNQQQCDINNKHKDGRQGDGGRDMLGSVR